MNNQKKKKGKRDLEQEREDLLRLMNKHIAPELKEKIDQAVSFVPKPTPINIKTSHEGASYANE